MFLYTGSFRTLSSLQKYLAGIVVRVQLLLNLFSLFLTTTVIARSPLKFCSIIKIIALFYSCSFLLLHNVLLQGIYLQLLVIPWCSPLLGKAHHSSESQAFHVSHQQIYLLWKSLYNEANHFMYWPLTA